MSYYRNRMKIIMRKIIKERVTGMGIRIIKRETVLRGQALIGARGIRIVRRILMGIRRDRSSHFKMKKVKIKYLE